MDLSAAADAMFWTDDVLSSGFLKPDLLRPAVSELEGGACSWFWAGCMKHWPSLGQHRD